ncbi:hypothetical protein [Shewanella subflava]|uniref:Uncharacterized protein n=1 Tax=Shewanella subflava TaxID=2986476 RepID=A0ABT3I688_9GAMM|nr:hypothetical protein [Shewanella subflava]MCW3171550.1 hypothetical protein [Shewanella subflava]
MKRAKHHQFTASIGYSPSIPLRIWGDSQSDSNPFSFSLVCAVLIEQILSLYRNTRYWNMQLTSAAFINQFDLALDTDSE